MTAGQEGTPRSRCDLRARRETVTVTNGAPRGRKGFEWDKCGRCGRTAVIDRPIYLPDPDDYLNWEPLGPDGTLVCPDCITGEEQRRKDDGDPAVALPSRELARKMLAEWEKSNAELGEPDPGVSLDGLTPDEILSAHGSDEDLELLGIRLGLGVCGGECPRQGEREYRCPHTALKAAISYRRCKLLAA
jgi:hypothetical protein